MREDIAKLRWRIIERGWGSGALLRYVWAVRCFRIRLMIRRTVHGMKQCGLAVAVAVDQVGLIRRESGMGLVDCVHSMEMVGRIVNVDGDTRSLRKPPFIGIRQSQKRRGCKREYKATASRWCERDVGADG